MSAHESIMQAVRAWLKVAATFPAAPLTDEQVIPFNDAGSGNDNPRPSMPYLTVNLIAADTMLGMDERIDGLDGASAPQVAIQGLRESTVSVQGFGAGAAAWLRNAAGTLELPTIMAQLTAAGLGIDPIGGMTDLSALIDTAIESRQLREFRVVYGYTSPFETVAEGEIVEALTVEVDTEFESVPGDPSPLTDTTVITL